jgi:Holliday junction resolvase-like predicted endonuclease
LLTEDDVVDATARYLRRQGYTIVGTARSTERGKDIVAQTKGKQLWVEAKGDTSGRPGSPRHGMQFNRSQAFDHCAKAFYVAVRDAQQKVNGKSVESALALPDNDINHERIDPIRPALKVLGIQIFWVSSDGGVRKG